MNTDSKPEAPQHPEHHFQHDPEQTSLERFLNNALERIEPYSNQILLGFLVVTVLAVGSIIWVRGSQASTSAAWQDFVACRVPDDYAKLAEDFPGTTLAAWARLQEARGRLEDGLNVALVNRKTSDEHLQEAKKAYEALLQDRASIPAEVHEEALYGIATTLEALSDGNNDPAVKAYEELITAYPNSQHRKWAESRVETLKTGASQEFYAWFRKQNPSPADRPLPKDFNLSPSSPLDSAFPDLKLPVGPDAKSTAPAAGAPAAETPVTLPAADAVAPAAPATETPAPAEPTASPPAASDATPQSESPATPATTPEPAPQ